MDAQITTSELQGQPNQEAEQAFIDYLIWSLAHEQDPHSQYDDPISVFRNGAQQDVA